MFNKRGLSQVVTTVLIILIVLAAIILIWAAIRPTIQSASEQITADCINVELEVISCTSGAPGTIRVKRHSGAGDLTGVIFVFSDGSIVKDETTTMPEPLQTVDFSVTTVSGDVNVAPIVGQGIVCPESSEAPQTC